MCFTTGAAIASLAATAIGTGISAYGSYQQGQAASKAASYNAQIAENNRTIAEQNAEYATRAGIAKAEQESLAGRSALGKIKARQSASGVTVASSSSEDVVEGAREANVLDVANVVQNAQLQAYGYKSQAMNFEAGANLARIEGANARRAGTLGALGTLLSGAGSLGGQYTYYSHEGII